MIIGAFKTLSRGQLLSCTTLLIPKPIEMAPRASDEYSTADIGELEKEDYLLSTEVDHSYADGKESGHPRGWQSLNTSGRRSHQKRTRFSRALLHLRRFRWLVDTILILVNICLSILLLLAFRIENGTPPTIQIGGDYSGGGPTCTTRTCPTCKTFWLIASSPHSNNQIQRR